MSDENRIDILLVENDEFSIILIKKILSRKYNIHLAKDGNSSIEMCRQTKYSIILMDINLGFGLNGLDATRAIKKLEGYENTPVIAITAYTLKKDIKSIFDAGCSHYFPKPLDIDKFLITLNEIVQQLD
ncbi:MAG: NarL family signal transduction histidine kinase [Ignavibacteria bacterium]|nr:NarL family signal transduction histidine kinase [Ignavibacteria bacterium]